MKSGNPALSLWLLTFGIGYAFFQVMPAFIPGPLAGPVTRADALDILTPFVVIPLAVFVFGRTKNKTATGDVPPPGGMRSAKFLFILALILYANGHGIHLAANSIDRLLEGQEGSSLHQAIYLFDEVISHFMWDTGVFLIAVALIWSSAGRHFGSLSKAGQAAATGGGLFFGFTFAVNAIEGQTVIFTFPAAVLTSLVCLYLWLRSRRKADRNPVVLFFLIAFLLAATLFAYWGISHQGFPEFSEIGWI
ncbi:MAG: hypothetical protein AB1715_05330 [Acidobacteriota bacterium]